jgi:hypothetical protein
MAYYNYKRVRDSIPDEWGATWDAGWKEQTGEEFDCSADYDGQLWVKASDYIDHLKARAESAENELAVLRRRGTPSGHVVALEAELLSARLVLEDLGNIPVDTLEILRRDGSIPLSNLAVSELARRAARKKPTP